MRAGESIARGEICGQRGAEAEGAAVLANAARDAGEVETQPEEGVCACCWGREVTLGGRTFRSHPRQGQERVLEIRSRSQNTSSVALAPQMHRYRLRLDVGARDYTNTIPVVDQFSTRQMTMQRKTHE